MAHVVQNPHRVLADFITRRRTRASVRHCRVSLEQKTRKKKARQHFVCSIATQRTTHRYFVCDTTGGERPRPQPVLQNRSVGGVPQPEFYIAVQMFSVLSPRYCIRRQCPQPDFFYKVAVLDTEMRTHAVAGKKRPSGLMWIMAAGVHLARVGCLMLLIFRAFQKHIPRRVGDFQRCFLIFHSCSKTSGLPVVR